jgi:dihydrofolate reductase
MATVLFDITMSLDGFVAGPDQSREHPLGRGGEHLHDWALGQKSFRESHGESGGETGVNDDVIAEVLRRPGAFVMGRNMFGGGPGPWPEPAWNGWWGDDPPYHAPVFVLTHHPREPLEMKGGTTFHFVTDGVEAAVARAKEAADGRDVAVAGGASAVQQALRAGLVEEAQIHLVPQLLCAGERLLDGLDGAGLSFEKTGAIDTPTVTHLSFRVKKES